MKQVICFDNEHPENLYFSNWYRAPFVINGKQFSSIEQFMMYEKAMLFDDYEIADKVLQTEDAGEIKALGRQVKNYDDHVWNGRRQIIVFRGLMEKFGQNPELKAALLETGDALLAECEPKDRIWGIGMSIDDPRRLNPAEWDGQCLLGYTLIEVREQLKSQ